MAQGKAGGKERKREMPESYNGYPVLSPLLSLCSLLSLPSYPHLKIELSAPQDWIDDKNGHRYALLLASAAVAYSVSCGRFTDAS